MDVFSSYLGNSLILNEFLLGYFFGLQLEDFSETSSTQLFCKN